MKKVQLGLVAISLGLASASVFAVDGTVTINGKVNDQTCTLGGTTGNYTVTLPTVGKSALSTVGATAGDTQFTINLTNCPAGKVAIYYENTNPNVNTAGRLDNKATATPATGVDIQLLNANDQVINLNSNYATQAPQEITTAAAGSANITFAARYFATAAATAGNVTSSTTYTVVYP